MPAMSFQSIIIEFAEAAEPFQDSSEKHQGSIIRLVESVDKHREFTLMVPKLPSYVLGTDETDRLLELLGQIAIAAPWQGRIGRDGTVHELSLLGAMSHVTFRWWLDAPQEWRSVGELFDHIISMVKPHLTE